MLNYYIVCQNLYSIHTALYFCSWWYHVWMP